MQINLKGPLGKLDSLSINSKLNKRSSSLSRHTFSRGGRINVMPLWLGSAYMETRNDESTVVNCKCIGLGTLVDLGNFSKCMEPPAT